jgi:hypothetical protein
VNPRPREICLMKKTGVQKSRETVPLKKNYNRNYCVKDCDKKMLVVCTELKYEFYL